MSSSSSDYMVKSLKSGDRVVKVLGPDPKGGKKIAVHDLATGKAQLLAEKTVKGFKPFDGDKHIYQIIDAAERCGIDVKDVPGFAKAEQMITHPEALDDHFIHHARRIWRKAIDEMVERTNGPKRQAKPKSKSTKKVGDYRARKPEIFGHPVTNILKKMSEMGFNPKQARTAIDDMGCSSASDGLVRTIVYGCRNGERGPAPELTKEQIKKLESYMK